LSLKDMAKRLGYKSWVSLAAVIQILRREFPELCHTSRNVELGQSRQERSIALA
jgi:hypothetical protein